MNGFLRPLLAALTLLTAAPALAQYAPLPQGLATQAWTEPVGFNFSSAPVGLIPVSDAHTLGKEIVLTGGAGSAPACDQACGATCQGGCQGTCCCPPRYVHRSGAFAEFLYMRARNAEVLYGTRVNGPAVAPPTPPLQLPPMGITDPDYSPGFRAGFTLALDDCSSLAVSYSYLDIATEDAITADPIEFIQPMLLHPQSFNAATNAELATARHDIDFQLVDVDYRFLLCGNSKYVLNAVLGARYGNLTQEIDVVYDLGGTLEQVRSKLNFDGGGVRIGLEGDRQIRGGFLAYGRGMANFLAGHLGGSYQQGNEFDPLIADVRWGAGRLISILELELGAGWRSKCGRWSVTGGYHVNAWWNMVPLDEFIRASQSNDFVDLTDTNHSVNFDGLAFRVEFRH
ncbi:MAG: hypothetical protein J5I93_11415 [Pirellulaceae bacterium]|nr:hypothetical protein [Pirellulaceae bacterium]